MKPLPRRAPATKSARNPGGECGEAAQVHCRRMPAQESQPPFAPWNAAPQVALPVPAILHPAGSRLRTVHGYRAERAARGPRPAAPLPIRRTSTGAPPLRPRGGKGRAWRNRCGHECLRDPRAESPPSGSPTRQSSGIAVRTTGADSQSRWRSTSDRLPLRHARHG